MAEVRPDKRPISRIIISQPFNGQKSLDFLPDLAKLKLSGCGGTVLIELGKQYLPKKSYRMLRSSILWAMRRSRAVFSVHDGVLSLRGIKINIDHPLVTPTIKNAILAARYENQESSLIQKFVNRSDIVLELGAGIGYITMIASKIVGPKNVYSFEANPELEPLLIRNFGLNDLAPQLTIAMLGRGSGEENFYVSSEFWASSLIKETNMSAVTVPKRDLNEVIKEIRPTVLICDIEGGEVDLVSYIDPQTIGTIILECHSNIVGKPAIDGMLNRLSYLGFERVHLSYAYPGAPLFQYVGSRNISQVR